MSKIYKGRWTARVEQEFVIEADSHEEFEKLLAWEMSPQNVVELVDFEHEVHGVQSDLSLRPRPGETPNDVLARLARAAQEE